MKFFDLFAGVGGFRLGFEREGFKCVGFCEIDKHARKLYKAYFGTEEKGEFEWDDVLTLNPDDVPDFEVLTAGFPCQPFSQAGKREGLKDGRAYPLWNTMFRIIERKRPLVCVFENVKGLLSANRGWSFTYFLCQMDELGYDAEWTVFNSKAFGVPQNRERVYVVCYFRERCRGEVFPLSERDKVYYRPPKTEEEIHENSELAGTLTARQYANWNGNFVYDSYNKKLKREEIVGALRTNYSNRNSWIVERKPKKVGNVYPSGGQAGNVYEPNGISPCLTHGCGKDGHWGGGVPLILANTVPSNHRAGNVYSPDGIAPTLMENHGKVVQIAEPIKLGHIRRTDSQGNRVYSPDGVAVTLLSGGGGRGAKTGLYLTEDVRIRRLTPLECFRLQGFPDDVYHKAKEIGISDTQLYKMTGNAVTVQIPQSIARKLRKVVFGEEK